jgi:hypothetical protein
MSFRAISPQDLLVYADGYPPEDEHAEPAV